MPVFPCDSGAIELDRELVARQGGAGQWGHGAQAGDTGPVRGGSGSRPRMYMGVA